MKIDIGIVVYKEYFLIDKQIEHWNKHIKGDFNLVIADSTPKDQRQNRSNFIPIDVDNSFDGISCGEATDFVANQCKTDIIGLVHPDFFFFNPNILFEIEEQFKQGYKCIGPQGFYPDFQRIVDSNYPDQRGDIAPTCWGTFFTRELATSDTFICLPPGVGKLCGWPHRKRIVDEKIPNIVWPGSYPFPDDDQITFFGDPEKPQGMHLLKGSGSRIGSMPAAFTRAMEFGMSKWGF